jgi:hypothetical protein
MTQDETTGRFNFIDLAARHAQLSAQYREFAALYEGNLANAYRDAAAAHQRLAVILERKAREDDHARGDY